MGGPVDVGSLQWRVDLPTIRSRADPAADARMGMGASDRPQIPAERMLAYHPIVLGDQVLVCDENRILAYNLNDRPTPRRAGEPSIEQVWRNDGDRGGGSPPRPRMFSGIPRYTLTAFGDRIYARLGPTEGRSMGGACGRGGGDGAELHLCVDRSTEGKQIWKKRRSEVPCPSGRPRRSAAPGFEGTPVADARASTSP